MAEEVNLVSQLAIILIAAGICTIISRWLKQPLILGYIIAGFLVGPHLGLFPQSTSSEAVEQWSEIGIIFLLFALGLEFSFKKLLKVGSSALITAGLNCIGLFTIGVIVGNLIGWTQMESIFLGGLLSMSSTTIIIKAYNDMGLMNKPYAPLIFGTLVVEDLLAVLLMVLLSTMAVSNRFAGGEMILSLAKLAFYLILWFVLGIYIIPTFLKKTKKFLNDEILLILSIGLCFGMVALASAAGFSSALGAFVMGSILSETIEGEKIGHLMGGIKDLFGAIFFVSVGMMIDPVVIGEHYLTILVICVVAMVGKLIFSIAGVLLSGKGLDTAVHTGFSLAQLGEFSFIIASLGVSLGVMREFIYPVIIAVSAITTFTTPYMIKAAGPAAAFLERKIPQSILSRIQSNDEGKHKSSAEKSEWTKLLKKGGIRIGLYLVLVIAINMAAKKYLPGLINLIFPFVGETVRSIIGMAVTIVVVSPLIFGMSLSNGSMSSSAKILLKKNQANIWPLFAIMVIRFLLAIACIADIVTAHITSGWISLLLIILITALLFLMMVKSRNRFTVVENRFFDNLNAKENQKKVQKMNAYDVHVEPVEVSSNFEYAGKTLREMPFRKNSGVNIVKIKRGTRNIIIPEGGEVIFPSDVLYAVGTSEQLSVFKKNMESVYILQQDSDAGEEFVVETIDVTEESYFFGKSLREIDMRKSRCMVVSILRGGILITNPKADFTFEVGDKAWIAGEKDSCAWYK